MTVTKKDEIKKLMDQVRNIAINKKNTDKIDYWEPQPDTARDHWRGTPKKREFLPRAPISVEPEIPMWGKILGFRIDDFYNNPEIYLEYQFKMMIYRFQEWNDETCIGKEIPIWLGPTFESSLFGADTIYTVNDSPWLDRNPVIKEEEDLEKLDVPDFYKTGLMPFAHKYYEVINELIDDDFKVTFPEWGRSPFGVAFHIRHFENLALDMATNPEFTHKLLRFITDVRKHWTNERARFLGMRVEKGNLYNDEVNTPTLSPKFYEDFVLPYEIELSEFHGGILYWHSCGDTTKLVHLIAKIPNLEMFHVGPWTGGERCVEVFKNKMPLEFCLHPLKDVQNANRKEMEEKLKEITEACDKGPYTVRADGLQLINGLEKDLNKIKEWIQVTNEYLLNH